MRLNLGQFLIGMAAFEVVAMWLLLRALPDDASEEQRRGRRIVLGAAIASGIVLCLVALFVPSVSEIQLF
jgi:Kef-type K+ transport system membrane component KefB